MECLFDVFGLDFQTFGCVNLVRVDIFLQLGVLCIYHVDLVYNGFVHPLEQVVLGFSLIMRTKMRSMFFKICNETTIEAFN